MNIDTVDLSALISTRICHDLISPIGAINNGLELLDAVGTPKGPELSLVNDSASAASAKLNIFRLAFGDAKSDVQIKGESLASAIEAMYGDSRIDVEWEHVQGSFSRSDAKLALLILFCIESSLPMGGTCKVSVSGEVWTFRATSQKLNVNSDLWGIATGASQADDVSPSHVHFLLAGLTASQIKKTVKLHTTEMELIAMLS